MKHMLCLALAILAVAACGPKQGKPGAGHPIIGAWELAVTPTCTETNTYRSDGTRSYAAAEEIGESAYTISAPDSRGVYTMVDTIVKDNGKPDCKGHIVPVGDVATIYIRFSPSLRKMTTCYDRALTRCITWRRVRDASDDSAAKPPASE